MDIAGATLVTAGLVVLVYALVDAESAGWGSGQTIGLLALAVVLLVGFVVVEGRLVRYPVMPLGIFRNRNVSSANAVALLVGASLFSMFFFISLYLQQVLSFSALDAGLAYLPLALTIIVSAGAASQLVTRVGPKPILVLGLVLTAIGLLLFTQVSTDGSYLGDVLIPSLVVAAGLGFSFVPLTITAVAGVTHHEAGLASGLINTAQQVGGALGLAVLSSIANSRASDVLGTGRPNPAEIPNAMTEGFQIAFAVGAGFALIGVVIALVAVPRVSREELPQEVAVGA